MAIIKGMEAQRRVEGEHMPRALRPAMGQGIAIYDLTVDDEASEACNSGIPEPRQRREGPGGNRVDPCGGTGLASCEPRPPTAALAGEPQALRSVEVTLDPSFNGPALGTEEEGLEATRRALPGHGARSGDGDDDDDNPPDLCDDSDDEDNPPKPASPRPWP